MLGPVIAMAWLCLIAMIANAYRSYRQYQKGSLTRANLVNQIYSVVILLMILIGVQLAGAIIKLF